MENGLFSNFAPLLKTISTSDLLTEIATPKRLLLETCRYGAKEIEVAYAPFDHLNAAAKIVIVGITPGRQQMKDALLAASARLKKGASEIDAMREAKAFASFSGPMRSNLVALLDNIGINKYLRITTTASLWDAHNNLVNFTSLLRYPVFLNGGNYNGNPDPLRNSVLKANIDKWFASEMTALPNAIFVPLGPTVSSAVEFVGKQIGFDKGKIISGLPHPSGANAERIAFFLGRKLRQDLSTKVDADKILTSRALLLQKISTLLA